MSSLHFNGNSMHFETFPFRHGFILFRYCRKMGFRCSFPKLSQTFFWTQISANWNAPKCSLEFECISELVTIHFGTNTRWLHKFHKSLIYSVKRHKLKFRTSIYIMEKKPQTEAIFQKSATSWNFTFVYWNSNAFQVKIHFKSITQPCNIFLEVSHIFTEGNKTKAISNTNWNLMQFALDFYHISFPMHNWRYIAHASVSYFNHMFYLRFIDICIT